MPSRKVRIQDVLGTLGVPLLRIQARPRHMGHGRVSSAKRILSIAKRVFLRCWLREPDVTTVTAKMARFQSLSDVFLDDNCSAGGVDEP